MEGSSEIILDTGGARRQRPPLTTEQILVWVDAHHERTGRWPIYASGPVVDAVGETWPGIDYALRAGSRGLPAGSSLARFLAEHRGVRNRMALPKLKISQILAWSDAHHARTGKWPSYLSGTVEDDGSVTWASIDNALRIGGRGLPGGSTLARLLVEKRGARKQPYCKLTLRIIIKWAKQHRRKFGFWPNAHSGPVDGVPGESWSGINLALTTSLRGLPRGFTLSSLLVKHCGRRQKAALPDLRLRDIEKWARAHRARTGSWPTVNSGAIREAPDQTWMSINSTFRTGRRGLVGYQSLAHFLDQYVR